MENTQERVTNELNGTKNDIASKLSQAKESASQAGHMAADTARAAYSEIKQEGKDLADKVCSQTSKSVDSVRDYVTNNPFRSVLAAAGVGLLVGYLKKR